MRQVALVKKQVVATAIALSSCWNMLRISSHRRN